MSEEIIEFAKLIVKHVRDASIRDCDLRLKPEAMSISARRWHKVQKEGDIGKFSEMLIADCVDEALFYFFRAIDDEILNLSYKSISGKTIDLTKDGLGELSGWYVGEWNKELSEQRHYDDL